MSDWPSLDKKRKNLEKKGQKILIKAFNDNNFCCETNKNVLGHPDLSVQKDGRIIKIELKSIGGELRPSQRLYINKYEKFFHILVVETDGKKFFFEGVCYDTLDFIVFIYTVYFKMQRRLS